MSLTTDHSFRNLLNLNFKLGRYEIFTLFNRCNNGHRLDYWRSRVFTRRLNPPANRDSSCIDTA